MNRVVRLAVGSNIVLVLALSLAGCGDRGNLTINNDGNHQVIVLTGDHELVVDPNGGVAVLNYGCTPGDVTVEFASAPPVVLPGPVCPEQQIAVGDGTAVLKPAS